MAVAASIDHPEHGPISGQTVPIPPDKPHILPKFIYIKNTEVKDGKAHKRYLVPIKDEYTNDTIASWSKAPKLRYSGLAFRPSKGELPDREAIWEVVDKGHNAIALKSCHGRYINGTVFMRILYLVQVASDVVSIEADATVEDQALILQLMRQRGDEFYLTVPVNGTTLCITPKEVEITVQDNEKYKLPKLRHAIHMEREFPLSNVMAIEPAVVKREIRDLVYELEDYVVVNLPPDITTSILHNGSTTGNPDASQASQTAEFSYEEETGGTWSNSLGYEISIETEFKAGIPLLASNATTLGLKHTGSFTWGGSNSTRTIHKLSETVNVPPGMSRETQLVVQRKSLTVNFKYTEVLWYVTGEMVTKKNNGVFNNVSTWNAQITVKDVPPSTRA